MSNGNGVTATISAAADTVAERALEFRTTVVRNADAAVEKAKDAAAKARGAATKAKKAAGKAVPISLTGYIQLVVGITACASGPASHPRNCLARSWRGEDLSTPAISICG